MRNRIRIYRVNEYEWYAGATLAACIDEAVRVTGGRREEVYDGDSTGPLSKKQMKEHIFTEESGEKKTFEQKLEEMIQAGHEFPSIFAVSE